MKRLELCVNGYLHGYENVRFVKKVDSDLLVSDAQDVVDFFNVFSDLIINPFAFSKSEIEEFVSKTKSASNPDSNSEMEIKKNLNSLRKWNRFWWYQNSRYCDVYDPVSKVVEPLEEWQNLCWSGLDNHDENALERKRRVYDDLGSLDRKTSLEQLVERISADVKEILSLRNIFLDPRDAMRVIWDFRFIRNSPIKKNWKIFLNADDYEEILSTYGWNWDLEAEPRERMMPGEYFIAQPNRNLLLSFARGIDLLLFHNKKMDCVNFDEEKRFDLQIGRGLYVWKYCIPKKFKAA